MDDGCRVNTVGPAVVDLVVDTADVKGSIDSRFTSELQEMVWQT